MPETTASARRHSLRGPKAEFIRQLCASMGLVDSRVTQMRLEHKLIQALVLRKYCPEAIPVTRGVGAVLRDVAPAEACEFLQRTFAVQNVLIKRALDFGSFERGETDARLACMDALGSAQSNPSEGALEDEVYVLQALIPIQEEYRVHTVEGSIVPELTYRRHGVNITPGERGRANAFVQSILDRLPNALIRSVVAGWDVALAQSGELAVLEVNLTGHHEQFDPGFHCSGYFLGRWAAPNCAKLLVFLERQYAVTLRIQPNPDAEASANEPFDKARRWLELHRIAGAIDEMATKYRQRPDVGAQQCPETKAFEGFVERLLHTSRTLRGLT